MRNHNIRQGKCDFADYEGNVHHMNWTVGLAEWGSDRKKLIRKTDIWTLRILIDDNLCVWFEDGAWNKRPPLIGLARRAYRAVLAIYS